MNPGVRNSIVSTEMHSAGLVTGCKLLLPSLPLVLHGRLSIDMYKHTEHFGNLALSSFFGSTPSADSIRIF